MRYEFWGISPEEMDRLPLLSQKVILNADREHFVLGQRMRSATTAEEEESFGNAMQRLRERVSRIIG